MTFRKTLRVQKRDLGLRTCVLRSEAGKVYWEEFLIF